MRKSTLWKKLLGAEHLVFEDGDVEAATDGGEVLVFGVRPDHGHRHRCSRCGRRYRRYDGGEGRRRWRALDAGTMRVYLEAEAPRVACLRGEPRPGRPNGRRSGTGLVASHEWCKCLGAGSSRCGLMLDGRGDSCGRLSGAIRAGLPGAAPVSLPAGARMCSASSGGREVVDAFFAAARGGDFDALVAVLDPGVVLRIDAGARRPAASMTIRGAAAVAGQAARGRLAGRGPAPPNEQPG